MHSMIRRLRHDDTGSALITALMAVVIMLGLGLALLSSVDLQASQSTNDRTRDRAFNLAESVLNSEAFVLGRNWPATAPTPNSACGAAGMGFSDSLGSTAVTADTRISKLRSNLNGSYTDTAYTGATWQVNVCDDVATSTVWSDTNLSNVGYDYNGGTPNNKVWVRAQATVDGKTRVVTGLVLVRTTAALNSKYALVSGGLKDDLGTVVNTLDNSVAGSVLTTLFGSTPTVASDPTQPATPLTGVTAVRCGALDVEASTLSTCVSGTIGALAALPVVTNLVTGGKMEQYPTTTTATPTAINQLRTQAIASNTYYSSSAGGTAASNTACTFTTNTGTRDANAIVFIEKVGTGDQYCVLSVAAGVQYKALVIGSGRVILRGNGTPTGTPTSSNLPQTNTFSGVVYALNLQRNPVADGGLGLGDTPTASRDVITIDSGAHVKGGVNADGKSARVIITPPALSSINMTQLRNDVCNPLPLVTKLLCFTLGTVSDLLGALGIPQSSVVGGLLNQLNTPMRLAYGSAIVSDVAAINKLTVFGASGVIPKTFHDLQLRT
jgi:Tfp pilus assembly protein PilX